LREGVIRDHGARLDAEDSTLSAARRRATSPESTISGIHKLGCPQSLACAFQKPIRETGYGATNTVIGIAVPKTAIPVGAAPREFSLAWVVYSSPSPIQSAIGLDLGSAQLKFQPNAQ